MKIAQQKVVSRTFGAIALVALFATSQAGAAPSDALQACLAKCNKGKLSETNRETCRLDCELDAATDPEAIQAEIARRNPQPSTAPKPGPATTPAPATPPAPALGRGDCKARCDADRSLSVDDRATCKLECDLDEEPGGAGRAPTPGPTVTTPGPTAPPIPAGKPPTVVAAATGAPGPAAAPVGFLTMCVQTCRSGPVRLSPTDLETCRLTCENAASVVDFALDAVPSMWMSVAVGAPQNVAVKLPMPASTSTPTPRPTSGTPTPAGTPTPVPAGTCEGALATCTGACDRARATCEKDCGRKHLKATDRETCKLDCGEGVDLCRADCSADNATCVNRRGG